VAIHVNNVPDTFDVSVIFVFWLLHCDLLSGSWTYPVSDNGYHIIIDYPVAIVGMGGYMVSYGFNIIPAVYQIVIDAIDVYCCLIAFTCGEVPVAVHVNNVPEILDVSVIFVF